MYRIINCRICCNSEQPTQDELFLNIKLRERNTGDFCYLNITLSDIKQLIEDGERWVTINGMPFNLTELYWPGGEKDLGWIVSLMLNAARFFGIVMADEYKQLVRKHFETYYLGEYMSKSRMCTDFYRRYFSEISKLRYGHYENMFKYYSSEIEEKGRPIYLQRGGEFQGCYYDDFNRCRPITSPKYYERVIPIAEKIWVCFTEEVNAA